MGLLCSRTGSHAGMFGDKGVVVLLLGKNFDLFEGICNWVAMEIFLNELRLGNGCMGVGMYIFLVIEFGHGHWWFFV